MAKIDLSGLTKEQIDQLRKDAKTKRADNRAAQVKARKTEKIAKAKAAKKDASKYYQKRLLMLKHLVKVLEGTDLLKAIQDKKISPEKALVLLAEMPERQPKTPDGWLRRHKEMTGGKKPKKPVSSPVVSAEEKSDNEGK